MSADTMLAPQNTTERTSELRARTARPLIPVRCEWPLSQLMQAYEYSQQLGRSVWDFAVEMDELSCLGVSSTDMRWLVCAGYVAHGEEITDAEHENRKFRRDRALIFAPRRCFVLTDDGVRVAQSFPIDPVLGSQQTAVRAYSVNERGNRQGVSMRPEWDRDRQELRWGTTVVKRFKVPAPNQEVVLAVFQEEGWPVHINDPLPLHPSIDPKRRLHDTINSLNRNQKANVIQFRGNGCGRGILWVADSGYMRESNQPPAMDRDR